ncbi:MAG: dimethyl sulfoxide reductase anchor subunit [Verrucomicrobia bacterium]|nr:dimethyl sulfoxide reductase anchor subunit [Verrucomicrobiota bacterium]
MTLPADNFTKSASATGERTLVDTLLDEQRQLTAVEAFARSHARHELTEPHYRKLLPASAPRPGEQYAFEVNLDQCSGCKACVTACHSLNGLDDGESWREVGALFGEMRNDASKWSAAVSQTSRSESGIAATGFQHSRAPQTPDARPHPSSLIPLHQTVTTACHHCVEPGCLLGCPVLAYDKDPLTGIVRHLDDQCIGCSYCILKCPYDVPKYSATRGIVRKCDMCHGRLAAGEAPACVQACPNEAIRISVVSLAEVKAMSRSASGGAGEKVGKRESVTSSDSPSHFPTPSLSHLPPPWLPDSPSPHITLPTTRYITTKPTADLRAADHSLPRPQPAHWPLILMLVLTQAGIGGLLAARFTSAKALPLEPISLAFLFVGLTASVFHLGQPLKAWRIWLGWRTSWLSREAIALNAFAGAAVTSVAAHWLPALTNHYSLITFPLCALALAAVFAQSMVYADTHRAFWSLRHTAPRFFGSALVLGIGLALAFQPSARLAVALLLVTLLKLASELSVLKHADTDSDRWTQLRRTAALQTGVLRPVLAVRLLAALVGGALLPFAIATGAASTTLAVSAFLLCLLGELAERRLFFTSVAPDKMPV